MNLFFGFLFGIIIIALLATGAVMSARYIIRESARRKRALRVGDLVWTEIQYEGGNRKMEGGADRITGGDLVGLVTLSESIKSAFPYKDRGVISFVWTRESDSSIHLYMGVTEHHYGNGSHVRVAAKSLGAIAVRVDTPPYIPVDDIAIAYRGKSIPLSSQELVKEGGSLSKALSSTLETLDKNVAVSVIVTAEFMRPSEQRQLAGYITADNMAAGGDAMKFGGMGMQAQQMSNQPIRTTLVAATSVPQSNGRSLAKDVLTSAANSISTSGWMYTVRPFNTAAIGKGGVVLAAFATVLSILLTVAQVFPWFIGVPFIIASVATAWFALKKAGVESLEAVRNRLTLGEFNVPPYVFWVWNPRWFIASRMLSMRYGGNDVTANEAAPSMRQVNYFSPLALYEAISFPPAFSRFGGDVASSQSLSRGIPGHMVETEYPIFFGRSGSGQFVSLDITDLHYSLYTAGAPNSGKTNFLQVIFAGVVKSCLEKTNGLLITPIWAETKGEGAKDAWSIARRHNRAMFIEAHNPRSKYRLALEGRRLIQGASVSEVVSNIELLVSGFQFAYGDGIRSASRDVLLNSLMIAMLLSKEDIEYLELEKSVNPNMPNIMDLAFLILGGDSRVDVSLAVLKLQEDNAHLEATDIRVQALNTAISNMSRFLDPALKRAAQSGSVLGPALNKISDLRSAKVLWTPDGRRESAYVANFPAHFAPIVLNMGPYQMENGEYDSSIGSAIAKRLILTTNYILWNTIKAKCSGWQALGRRIPMFFDEVADVAVDSKNDDVANVIAEAGKEGRSRGAAYYIGSQSPSQLPLQARSTALGSRTKFWFNMHESNDLKVALAEISSASDEQDIYSTNDVHTLPNGTAIGVMQRGDKPTPPFTLRVPLATEWGAILLRKGVTVQEAIVEYYEQQSRKEDERRRAIEGSRS